MIVYGNEVVANAHTSCVGRSVCAHLEDRQEAISSANRKPKANVGSTREHVNVLGLVAAHVHAIRVQTLEHCIDAYLNEILWGECIDVGRRNLAEDRAKGLD
jgi:hypothetical protein